MEGGGGVVEAGSGTDQGGKERAKEQEREGVEWSKRVKVVIKRQ